MPEPRTCHLPNSKVLFCVAINGLGLAMVLQRHSIGILVSGITKSEDQR